MMSKSTALFCTALCLLASEARGTLPALPEGVALYAGGDITFFSFSGVQGGDTVAGGDIYHYSGSLDVESIYGGGSFFGSGTQDSTGQWYFNGDILGLGGPGSVIGGPVRSTAGNIDFRDSSQDVFGDVVAKGNIDWQFSIADIFGDVIAGGIATVTPDVSGTIVSGADVNLPTYVPPALPAGRNLTPSNNDVRLRNFEDVVLQPGTYGNLILASSNTVGLSSGSYVFNDLINNFSLNEFLFDTTNGPIDIYFANDVELNMVQVINGVSNFGNGTPDPLEANNIIIESGEDIELNSGFIGTIFAPDGSVTLNSGVTGKVFAGEHVWFFGGDVEDPGAPPALGDLNGDGTLTNADIASFVQALTDPAAYASAFPELDHDVLGDFSGDGLMTNGDIAGFVAALTGGGGGAVPEPGALSLLAFGGLLVARRRCR